MLAVGHCGDCLDTLQHAREITLDLIGREPEHPQPEGGQHSIALSISFEVVQMRWIVNFNNKCSGMAVEIHDEARDDLLPAGIQPCQAMCAQSLPEQ